LLYQNIALRVLNFQCMTDFSIRSWVCADYVASEFASLCKLNNIKLIRSVNDLKTASASNKAFLEVREVVPMDQTPLP